MKNIPGKNKCAMIVLAVFFLFGLNGCGDGGESKTRAETESSRPASIRISSPSNEETYFTGKEIIFEATNNEGETIKTPVTWISDLDGQIGMESRFKYTQLTAGTHTITARMKDGIGNDVSDRVGLTIEKFTWAAFYRKNDQLSPRISDDAMAVKDVDIILKTTKNFDRKNLSGLDMSARNFSGASFEYAFMVHSNFSNSDFRTSNLKNAAIEHSDLTNVKLADAELSGVDFTSAKLINIDMNNADLTGSQLSDLNLKKVILFGAKFTNCNLSGSDLSKLNLVDSDLSNAVLKGANLANANLSRSNFRNADLDGANLTNANLEGALNLDKARNLGSVVGL